MKLGIDFGTCYSSAALFINGNLKPVKEPLKPIYSFASSLFVTKDNQIIIGQAAENQRRLDPNRYCCQFKRNLGQKTPYTLGERQLLPEELVREILRGLKTEAQKLVNQSLDSVILTVPATYQSYKKGLMESSAKQAGFEEVILLEEPVAAAIYYSQNRHGEHQLKDGEILLVYDLGGGTFDAALIQKQGVNWELLTQPIGDSDCGGIDFDRQIYQHLRSTLSEKANQLLDSQRRDVIALRTRLMVAEWCREFKHQLSLVSEYEDLLPIGDLSESIYHLSQLEFEEMITPFIDRTCELCRQLVRQANLQWEQVNRILLVGGSCRIPYIKTRLKKEFEQSMVVCVDEPELAICFGAALYGNWLENEGYKAYCQQGKEKLESGDYQGAISSFNQSIRLNAKEADAFLYNRGTAYFQEGLQKALSDYEQAIAINPNLAEAVQKRDEIKLLSQSDFSIKQISIKETTDSRKKEETENIGVNQVYTETLPGGVKLEMVYIPAGELMMGENKYQDEQPIHQVRLKAFYLGKYPVTQAQYQAIMGENPSYFKGENNPVEKVNWYQAQEFCQKLSRKTGKKYQLPSEAQWEYACRAGTKTRYYFGDDESQLREYAWYKDNSNKQTHPVERKKPNQWGLYDLHGNVWEWCADTWHNNYKGAPTDGSAWTEGSDYNRSSLRGGSWRRPPGYCRSASRSYAIWGRGYINDLVGFRVVCGVGRT